MKKLVCLLLVFALTASLAGCVNPERGENTEAEKTSAESVPDDTEESSKETESEKVSEETAPETSADTDVTEPESKDSGENEADDPDFSYAENEDGTVTVTGYSGKEAKVTIPAELGGKIVSAIGESCFAGNIFMEKVYVPEGVTEIQDYAFECCSVLKKVYLPETLETIGDGTFSGCVNLYLLDIQDNVTSIGKGAFLECTALLCFNAPAKLQNLGNFAFANCANLLAADLSNTALADLPDRAFFDDGSLIKVKLPESLKTIGVRAFTNCASLGYIYLPAGVESIETYAFASCTKLNGISVPCAEIRPYCFADCYGMQYISFSENLKKIDAYAFANLVFEEEPYIPEGVEVEEHAFGPVEWYEPVVMPDDEETEADTAPKETDTTDTALNEEAKAAGYRVIANDDFEVFAEEYLAFNEGNALLERDLNPYIMKYKGQIGHYYRAMTAVANHDPDAMEFALKDFGEDFEEMYTMINHGLTTEINRFKMKDDLLLLTGVYDCQLIAAAGTDHVPTLDELKACIGKTFTDPSLTSTTPDAKTAFHFGDTLFVIYAPAENLNAAGAVCMDAFLHSNENEILIDSGASYEILDVGIMSAEIEDWDGNVTTEYRQYVKLQLISE